MTELLIIMEQFPLLLLIIITILGLLVGSFLNVVIFRLPLMMDNECKAQCVEIFPDLFSEMKNETFNLALPKSHCPICLHPLGIMENIPLISWICLKGHCKNCSAKISIRYPFIEFLTAFLSLIVALIIPFGFSLLLGLIFTWFLIALTFIDLDTMLLPDQLTIPLLWGGLLINIFGIFVPISDAVLGATLGYMFLWTIYWAFKLITGKEGMGYGDFKLLAALGAWFGWQSIPLLVLLSSVIAALVGFSMLILTRVHTSKPTPFGPYLAIAGFSYLIYGQELTSIYYYWIF